MWVVENTREARLEFVTICAHKSANAEMPSGDAPPSVFSGAATASLCSLSSQLSSLLLCCGLRREKPPFSAGHVSDPSDRVKLASSLHFSPLPLRKPRILLAALFPALPPSQTTRLHAFKMPYDYQPK